MTTTERIKKIIAEQIGVNASLVIPPADLHKDLGADSFDYVEMILVLEYEFDIEISDEEAGDIRTVADVIAAVEKLLPAE